MKALKTTIALALMPMLIVSCQKREIKNNIEGSTYNHFLFETEAECLAAQPTDFFLNCFQSLHFIDEDEAEIILTDIVNHVEYKVKRGKIILYSTSNSPDIADQMEFEYISENELMHIESNTRWLLQTGSSPWE
jgi:hypothetical protein